MSERKYKVLIVDDSETNRAILNEILCGEYIIAEADSGEKAVEILKRDQSEIYSTSREDLLLRNTR
ncbi:MAG: hypothetical protein ACI4K7_11475 [Oscillospiraceae bacterium]